MTSLLKIIAEGEHQQQDFKFEISDSRKIARTLSAFANTDGGRMLVGVKDNGSLAGVRSKEEIHMIEGASDLYCLPPVEVEYQMYQVDGKEILEALIQPSPLKPHFVKEKIGEPKAYFRKDDENFPANGVLIKLWTMKKNAAHFVEYKEREAKLLSFLQDMPYITVKKYAAIANVSIKKSEEILATFLNWGILRWHFNGKYFQYFLAS